MSDIAVLRKLLDDWDLNKTDVNTVMFNLVNDLPALLDELEMTRARIDYALGRIQHNRTYGVRPMTAHELVFSIEDILKGKFDEFIREAQS